MTQNSQLDWIISFVDSAISNSFICFVGEHAAVRINNIPIITAHWASDGLMVDRLMKIENSSILSDLA